MRVNQIVESPFRDSEDPLTMQSYENKVYACTQAEQLLVDKIRYMSTLEAESVYITDASSNKIPPTLQAQLDKDRNSFITFVLSSDVASKRSKVWIKKSNPQLVKRIRGIIDRHNKISNTKAEFQGKLAQLKRT